MRDCFRSLVSPHQTNFELWLRRVVGEGFFPSASVYDKTQEGQSQSYGDAYMKPETKCESNEIQVDARGGILIHYNSQDLDESCYNLNPPGFYHCSADLNFVWDHGSGDFESYLPTLSSFLQNHPTVEIKPFPYNEDLMCLDLHDDTTLRVSDKRRIRVPRYIALKSPYIENEKRVDFDSDTEQLLESSATMTKTSKGWKFHTKGWKQLRVECIEKRTIPQIMYEPTRMELDRQYNAGTFESNNLVRVVEDPFNKVKVIGSKSIQEFLEQVDSKPRIEVQFLDNDHAVEKPNSIKISHPEHPHRVYILKNDMVSINSMRTRCVLLLPETFDVSRLTRGGKRGNVPVAPEHVVITNMDGLVLNKVETSTSAPLDDPVSFSGTTHVFQVQQIKRGSQ